VFHSWRGSQKAIFGDAKDDTCLDIIPFRQFVRNQVFTTSAMMANNLSREIQMLTKPSLSRALPRRSAVWKLEKLDTIRHGIIQRAGRISRPQGDLTLTLSASQTVRKDIQYFVSVLQRAV